MKPALRFVGALAAGALTSAAAGQTCTGYWRAPGAPPSTYVRGGVSFDDGSGPALYFRQGLGSSSAKIMRWRSSHLEIIDGGLGSFLSIGIPHTLHDGVSLGLYVTVSGFGLNEHWLSKWDGSAWHLVWPGIFDGSAPRLSVDVGDGMYIYGSLTTPSGYAHVHRWHGTHWVSLGTFMPSGSFGLHTWDDGTAPGLYASGSFVGMLGSSDPIHGLARWTGTQWVEVLPPQYRVFGIGSAVNYDDGTGQAVYMIASVQENGQWVAPGQVLKWDGQVFTGIGGPIQFPFEVNTLRQLHVFEEGTSSSIVLIGGFHQIEGNYACRGICRWDGQWHSMGPGLRNGSPWALASMPTAQGPSLFVMGESQMAGGGVSPYLAQWVGCPNCYANCDGSTAEPRLNVEDFICFVSKFAARDPYANCDLSTTEPFLDVEDFMCFVRRFVEGCAP
jgi:hypothetical protein